MLSIILLNFLIMLKDLMAKVFDTEAQEQQSGEETSQEGLESDASFQIPGHGCEDNGV